MVYCMISGQRYGLKAHGGHVLNEWPVEGFLLLISLLSCRQIRVTLVNFTRHKRSFVNFN